MKGPTHGNLKRREGDRKKRTQETRETKGSIATTGSLYMDKNHQYSG